MYFSHILLPRTPEAVATYSSLLANPYVEHQHLWSMLNPERDDERSFLYRSDMTEKGFEMYVLSAKPPAPPAPWICRSRPYELKLRKGQLLEFSVRINPTYDKAREGKRSQRVDQVMERYIASQAQASIEDIAQAVGHEWLAKRAPGKGFSVAEVQAQNYTRINPTKKGAPMGKLARLDLQGLLVVQDPELFTDSVVKGLGKAKFAGCGLMLLKPPRDC